MITSSRFTVAIHILTLLAMEDRMLSSAYIAKSVNTNPVVIRRILGNLAQAGLITTQMGSEGGASLSRSPESINLLEIYRATEQGELFSMPSSIPNPACKTGRNIQPVLTEVFGQVEQVATEALATTTIAEIAHATRVRDGQTIEL